MITNARIERKKSDIARTEVKFAEIKAKLREQKLDLIRLENEEIVAMFRNEIITEDDFAALMRSRLEAANGDGDDLQDEQILTKQNEREEKSDAFTEK